ncbi:4a-hydroxytetrahydrobiopterin dehydratase [Antrihabitans cavernicola]|uniref:Putative pterin-4-alpha-carbinolamine dehydratase n=1 Tax=Antrihabitans cavernicola TaxID=2495913 RepID=A0A5A7S9P0_9NOCA|nr:4a-hydroxytetrahydrobiopterin dehydratase [Spelaeibacter cavernicola]KAA0022616.1 4a-hydroxytetrahydrobiopterin dehydratase [Spelaeibacter cavernicola]
MALLTDSELSDGLADLPDWTRSGDSISRAIEAPTFPDAIELVRKVADEAETAQHHPDIDIRWRTVTFVLSTHSDGGLTAKDLALAATIDRLAAG